MSTAVEAAPVAVTTHDGPSDLKHLYCAWCWPEVKTVASGAVAACGYRRPPGPLVSAGSPSCVVCVDLVGSGQARCAMPDCVTRWGA